MQSNRFFRPASLLGCCIGLILLASIILGIIALAIPDWLTGEYVLNSKNIQQRVGLFSSCGSTQGVVAAAQVTEDCRAWGDVLKAAPCDDLKSALDAVAALTIVGLVLLLLALCLVCASPFFFHWALALCAFIIIFLAAVLLLVATIIFPVLVQQKNNYACNFGNGVSQVCPNCDLDAGWILLLISMILAWLALCLTCCLGFLAYRARRRRLPTPPVSPVFVPQPPLSPCLPVPVCPPMGPCGMDMYGCPDPLMNRMDLVRSQLRHTLATDISRTGFGPTGSPVALPPGHGFAPGLGGPIHVGSVAY